MSQYTPIDLEDFVRRRAPEIARGIQEATARSNSEADLVAEVEDVLKRFEKNFDISLHLERERTLINGRADAIYNRFVIEYESPGSLRRQPDYRHNQHAIGQVKQYIEDLERLDRHKKERLAGVVLDGRFFIFVRYRDEHWRQDDPLPVSTHSTETFLRYLLSLSTELALTPENLVRDFGENTTVSRLCVHTLYEALARTNHPRVHILFQQWQRQFGEITGWEKQSSRLDLPQLARNFGIREKNPDPLRFFFAVHTYYATFIKLLAVQVAQYYLMPKLGTGLAQVAAGDSQSLRSYLSKMEIGGVFADFGIRNFLEGDFFGWYLDTWDEEVDAALRRLIGDLANYSLVTLDVDPEETRDLLKYLYQNLMPKKLRHALGEYYTPDWLAERLLNQLGVTGMPTNRLLDPACGSGTFLVLTIKRIRQYADEQMLPAPRVLEEVLDNVVGFDLNPLAVISARTNYLLALGDLLQSRRGEISIPVYLADSILTPTAGRDLFTQHAYSFNTAVGRFSVPKDLVQARYIDQLAQLLEQSVTIQLTADQFRSRLLGTFPLDEKLDSAQISVATKLYEQLLELDAKAVNGIWARIIKNAFAPLFQGRFDYIAGNPPWVNWESLPEHYRDETKPLWMHHGLFPHSGMDTILGKGKKDISMLMTYVALDNYLKDRGRLGFVITQSVFKTAGAGQGFRRFVLGSGVALSVVSVDDMAELKPFEGASNRTAIVILDRGRKIKYPVQYNRWYKPGGGTVISEDMTLEEISSEKIATYRQFVAEPVDETDLTSPWITGKGRAVKAVKKVLGVSDYEAHEGANSGGANAIYWLEIVGRRPDGLVVVSNITEGAKRKVENVQAVIEPYLLHPLLRGRDVNRWQAESRSFILMVQDPDKRRGYDEEWLIIRYPKTYGYLKRFEDVLRQRRSQSVRNLMTTGAFYSMFGIGDYTFAPYKVVWPWISSSLISAVVGSDDTGKAIIPEHNTSFVAFDDEEEAHYFCSCFNSSPANFAAVSSYSGGGGGIASPRVVERIRVPRYNQNNSIHSGLAILSQQAHDVAVVGDKLRLREIEAEIDRLAGALWGLTEAELREIQESLGELGYRT